MQKCLATWRFKTYCSVLVLVLAALVITYSAYSSIQTGLKIPEVPLTGGKKLHFSKDGKIADVQPMPGIPASKTIAWEEATSKYFDFTRAIPKPRPQELTSSHGMNKKVSSTIDLPRFMKIYTAKLFTDPKYGANEEWVQSFGNIMNEFKAVKGNAKKTDELLAKLKSQYPVIDAELSPYLEQLVRDDFLYSTKWTPYKDESVKGKQNDGILFVDHWYMQADPSRNKIWNEDLGEHKVYQGAAVLYADVKTIKEMERDYANYFSQIGQDYMEVYPVPNSYYRGMDAQGNDFFRVELYLRNDLPFPYESASYVMNIFEHFEEGHLVADYYSTNREDLNWMAGRDTYFEIFTTKGDLVGNMIVTILDFDIKNVPERDIDRIITMKAGLGNMKRISEALLDKRQTRTAKKS